MSKPNEIQKKVIDVLIKELESWKRTNDIDSPTHHSDLISFLLTVDIDKGKLDNIARKMNRVLNEIKLL